MAGHRRGDDDGLSDEERRLLAEEMRGVRPIDRSRTRVTRTERPAPIEPRAPDVGDTGPLEIEVESDGEPVSAFDRSVPPQTRRALRQGKTRPEAQLDLHGRRAAEARRRVESFVSEAQARGWRCVLIVT